MEFSRTWGPDFDQKRGGRGGGGGEGDGWGRSICGWKLYTRYSLYIISQNRDCFVFVGGDQYQNHLLHSRGVEVPLLRGVVDQSNSRTASLGASRLRRVLTTGPQG